ncbi:MAG: pyrroline-5-carboxylate reductase [Gammaproteobacteria bacterium]
MNATPPTLAFIGGGNMARSLIGGLVADQFDATRIWVADPLVEGLDRLRTEFGIHTTADNTEAARRADVVILAVKPQLLHEVCSEIAETIQSTRPLVVSIAAGVREQEISRWLGGGIAIVRSMPNTPALVQSGATALYANALVDSAQRERAEMVLRSVGITLWVDREEQLDAVTALSGSGPAYFFLFMEHLENAARELGLPAETAHLLTLETAFGAARMALSSNEGIAELRRRVTSPGGTTERALEVFAAGKLDELVAKALRAACDRSRELAELFGKQ